MFRWICRILMLLMCLALIIPSILFFMDEMDLDHVKVILLITTISWFVVLGICELRNRSESF